MSEYTKEFEAAVKDRLDPVDTDELFAEVIDVTNEEVEVMGLSFRPSEIVRQLDPVAFRTYMNDFLDGEARDGELVYVADGWYRARDVEELREELEHTLQEGE